MQSMLSEMMAGLTLGAVGGGLHLLVTRLRARLAIEHRNLLSSLLFPVGLAFVGLAVWLGSLIAPHAAWAAVFGLLVVRAVVLSRLRTVQEAGER